MNDFYERISALSPKRLALLAMELQSKLDAAERARNEPIAIIGMGCRVPGANNPAAFWELLRDGVDAISETPPSRWDNDAYYDPDAEAPGKIATRWGGFIEPINHFEPQVFGISPREALSMDPQQRLLLEVAWEALEQAGYAPPRLAGTQTGVFVGICNTDYGQMLMADDPTQIDAYLSTGNAHSIASGRLSYTLGLQGPALSVDTACSSSLVAIHLAIRSLRNDECRMALAGGSNALLSPVTTITLSRARMMAADGRCKTFDARADGFVRGEGCGVIVLKRLSHARADGDNILAVVRGSAINQDGRSNGLTAPNGPSQVAVIRAALADAGLAATDIQYVESHGTGTSLGDPIEVQALDAALGAGRTDANRLQIGSVKTNLGHLESAAGVVGLIKLVLMMQHGEIPPHLHLTELNPHIAWNEMPIDVPTQRTPWAGEKGKRIGGVSSFGFSGTNGHIILESAPEAQTGGASRDVQLFTFAARTEQSLRALAERYVDHLAPHGDTPLADIAYTTNSGRAHFAQRLALTADSSEELRAGLAAWLADEATAETSHGHTEGSHAPRVVFMFTGAGSHYAGMGRALYQNERVFREAIDACDALLRGQLDYTLHEILFPDAANAARNGSDAGGSDAGSSNAGDLLDNIAYAQPALFAIQYALVQLWRAWGITPAAVVGHSAGEYAAAVTAGVMSLADGLRLVTERGRLMASLPPNGEMASIFASEDEVTRILAAHAQSVTIGAINAPESIVISGPADEVETVLAEFDAVGIETRKLKIPIAAHSAQVEPILDAFAALARTIAYAPPTLEVVSGMTGAPIAGDALATADYWRQHLRQPVRFAAAAQTLHAQGYHLFLEIGPHTTLIEMMRRTLPAEGMTWIPSMRRKQAEHRQILASLGALMVAGVNVDWSGFYQDEKRRRIPLPTYPFAREQYWIETTPHAQQGAGQGAIILDASAHPLLGARLHSPALNEIVFEAHLHARQPAFLDHHRIHGVVLLPSPVYIEMAYAAARQALTGQAWTISDFAIHEACILPESGARIVQTLLTRTDEGARVQVFGRDAGSDTWVLHAVAELARAQTAAPATDFPRAEIQARCNERVDAAAYYARLRTLGLAFGESFTGLREIWRRDGEALGRIELPQTLHSDAQRYNFHPAQLDATLHLLGALVDTATLESPYLLVGVDSLRIFKTPTAQLWSHVQLDSKSSSGDAFTCNLRLHADDGTLVVEASGLHLRLADRDTLLRATRQLPRDWFYEVQWQEQAPSATNESVAPQPLALDEIATRLAPIYTQQARTHDLARYAEFVTALEELSADYVMQAFHALGWYAQPGARVQAEALAEELGIVPQQRRLLPRLLGILQEVGMLRADGDGWLVISPLPKALDLSSRATALQDYYALGSAEIALTAQCGAALADVLRGRQDPLHLLFPGGSLARTQALYRDTPPACVYNTLIAQIMQALTSQPRTNRPLRILEIGGGSGATTSVILPLLPASGVEYWFTDVSPLFMQRAAESFEAFPFLRTYLLDVEQDPVAQGLPAHGFDIVIAANVLHATADLRQALANVQRALAPAGMLLLLEGVQARRWVDITFGLTEGWWRFTDRDLRAEHPLLTAAAWTELLAQKGFGDVQVIPAAGERADQVVLMARAQVAPIADAPHWLILADAGGVGEQLAATLAEQGAPCALVLRGDTYARLGAQRWQVDATAPVDLQRVLDELDTPDAPRRVVYLWGLDATASEEVSAEEMLATQEIISSGAVALAQALQGRNARVWFVTRGAQAVEQEHGADVAQAPLWGIGRVFALEQPEQWGGLIDLPSATPAQDAAALLEMIENAQGEDQLALRAGRRYAPRLARTTSTPVAQLDLRADGTYLITGGLGGLGLKVAKWLAERGARHLVLTGRSGLPDRATWDDAPAASRTAQQISAIRAIEALGATVHVARVDVAARAPMETLFARFGADLPPLRGLIHAAAELSAWPMRAMPLDALRGQLRAKLQGGWLLHELTRTLEIDFFVLFSSTTSLWGVRDLAHYAAANQALDALAHHRRAQGLPALSINWGTWDEMRIASADEQQQVASYGLRQMSAQQALACLGALIAANTATQQTVADVEWRVLKPAYEARGARPFLALMSAEERPQQPHAEESTEDKRPLLLRRLQESADEDRHETILTFVQQAVAQSLGVKQAQQLDARQGLFEMGMDSLMSIDLKSRLEKGVGRALPSTLTFNYPTIEALTGYLESEVVAQEQAAAPATEPAQATIESRVSETKAAADDLDDYSEDELAAMIAAKLAHLS